MQSRQKSSSRHCTMKLPKTLSRNLRRRARRFVRMHHPIGAARMCRCCCPKSTRIIFIWSKINASNSGWSGCILTNPNCTSTGLTIALKALDDAFGVKKVFAVSLQALSGAGYPGVPSLDIIDNVIPNMQWRRRGKSGMGTAQDAWQIE